MPYHINSSLNTRDVLLNNNHLTTNSRWEIMPYHTNIYHQGVPDYINLSLNTRRNMNQITIIFYKTQEPHWHITIICHGLQGAMSYHNNLYHSIPGAHHITFIDNKMYRSRCQITFICIMGCTEGYNISHKCVTNCRGWGAQHIILIWHQIRRV